MTTQYTPSLRLALPGTGELDGLWGQVVNDQITELLEQALTGRTVITTWTFNAGGNEHTLTSIDGTVDEARAAVIVAQTGNGIGSGEFRIFAPAQPKAYVLRNETNLPLRFLSVASGATSVVIPVGHTACVYCDGTNSYFSTSYLLNPHSSGVDLVDGTTVQSYVTLGPGSSQTLDAAFANFYRLPNTGGGPVSITLNPTNNAGISNYVSFLALLVNPGSGSLIWPASVRWPNNTAPIINVNTYNLFLFTQYSGTTQWYGAVLNNYIAF